MPDFGRKTSLPRPFQRLPRRGAQASDRIELETCVGTDEKVESCVVTKRSKPSAKVPWPDAKKRRWPGTMGPASDSSTLSSLKELDQSSLKPKLSRWYEPRRSNVSVPSRVRIETTPEVASPTEASAPVVTTSTSPRALEPRSRPKPVPASGSLALTPSTT